MTANDGLRTVAMVDRSFGRVWPAMKESPIYYSPVAMLPVRV